MNETKEQKVERIAVGLAVADKLVELAFTRSIAAFKKKLAAHRFKKKFMAQLETIGYNREEFWREVKKMKADPDYNNPEVAYDDEATDDEKP